jgi:hypothetical protein
MTARSLTITNFPYAIAISKGKRLKEETHDNDVFTYLDPMAYLGGFNDAACSNRNEVCDPHRIKCEGTSRGTRR